MLQLSTTTDEGRDERATAAATLDELARAGAQRMIEAALRVEVEDYLARHRAERDAAGHAVVVRNGTARPITAKVGTERGVRRSAEGRIAFRGAPPSVARVVGRGAALMFLCARSSRVELDHVTVHEPMVSPDVLSVEAGSTPHAGVLERACEVLVHEPGDVLHRLAVAQDERPIAGG